ncbi:MAG: hypothetical protein ACYC67_06300 [Prosthecobacter sp.]|jgi:hypothetical protein
MKSHPILEAIAVFISLAACACISIDDHEERPKTATITKETARFYSLADPSVTMTTTKAISSR